MLARWLSPASILKGLSPSSSKDTNDAILDDILNKITVSIKNIIRFSLCASLFHAVSIGPHTHNARAFFLASTFIFSALIAILLIEKHVIRKE